MAADVVVVAPTVIDSTVPLAVRVVAFVGVLCILGLVGVAVLLVVEELQYRRRVAERRAARQAEELAAQAREKARPAHVQHVAIVPDVAGPLDRATAWRDIAACSELEEDFR